MQCNLTLEFVREFGGMRHFIHAYVPFTSLQEMFEVVNSSDKITPGFQPCLTAVPSVKTYPKMYYGLTTGGFSV